MNLRTRLLTLGAALAIAAAPLAASAESFNRSPNWSGPGKSYGPYRPGYNHHPNPNYYGYGWRYDRDDNGAAVAAGIAGLAVGAMIGSAASAPAPVYRQSTSMQPWSPAWYQYCESKYRSFDRNSGTYLGYDGQRHFCQ
ncbi:BA14K family protein [Microbaculum marinum]|uniref:Lectin-like protein BA14k n=1 Tax=Microbaculum marinum TaxID=1764581 RepID=A0AAW9RJP1_9HYPH